MYLEKKNYYETKILTYICREIYLVDNLKTKFLIKIDIFGSEHITINIFERKLYFGFCEKITVFCEIKARDNVRIRRTVRITKKKIISAITTGLISVILKEKEDLSKRDFLFESTISEIYVYFVNFGFEFINIRNDKNVSLKLNNCRRVSCIVEYKNEEYYAVEKKNHFLTTISLSEDYFILFKLDFMSAGIRFSRKIIFKKIEIQLNNSIIVYGISEKIAEYLKIIERHSRI